MKNGRAHYNVSSLRFTTRKGPLKTRATMLSSISPPPDKDPVMQALMGFESPKKFELQAQDQPQL